MHVEIVGCVPRSAGLCTPSRASRCAVIATIYALGSVSASADSSAITTRPDPPARTQATPSVGTAKFRPSWDLDGFYLWLGPTGAASVVDDDWDSTFGGDLAIVRVRERSLLGVLGVDLGGAMWTARGGGRVWLDALVGTRIGEHRMLGLSIGPIVELHELQHPRIGGSIGAWAFFGITPFARVGVVDELGAFVDVGIHIALPVVRH